MSILIGLNNLLDLIINQWATIAAFLSLLWIVYKKIQQLVNKIIEWYKLSDNEKIECAKSQIKQSMLKYITDAELIYDDMQSSGQIKRSQVIKTIYQEFPILSKVQNHDELINWIDEQINTSLKILREIKKKNEPQTQ